MLFLMAPVYIIIIGTTAPFEPRPSSEASASCPYSLQHSSNFSPPTSHLNFGLPLCLLPSTTATRTLLVGLCSSIRIICPAHFNRLILMYVTISLSLYKVYNSLLYFILHFPLTLTESISIIHGLGQLSQEQFQQMQRWNKGKSRHVYVQGRNKMHVLNRSYLTDFVSVLNHWFRCLGHFAMNTATDNSLLCSIYKSRLLLGSSQFQIAAQ